VFPAFGHIPFLHRKVWFWPALALAGLVLLLLAFAPLSAPPQSLVSDVAKLEDRTAALDIGDVQEMAFAPSATHLAEGYTRSAFWFRMRLHRPEGKDESVVLRFFPPVLDEISVFTPAPDIRAGWTREDLHLRADTALRGTLVSVPPEGVEVFVRVASVGSITAAIDVMTRQAALSDGLGSDMVQFAYLALMLVLMVWSLRMYALTADRLFLGFAAVQMVWIPHNMLIFGYLPLLLDFGDGWQFRALRFLAIVNSVAGFAFHRAVLRRHDPPLWALRGLDVLTAISASMMFYYLLGDRALALRINGLCIFVFPFLLLLNVALARRGTGAGLVALRLVYLLFCTTLFLWIFTLLGFGHAQANDRYSVILHGLSTGLLMFILLRLHGKGVLAVLRRAEEALVAAETLRNVERRYSEIRLRFIDMLAHETRNALAVINMSVAGPVFADRQRKRVMDTISDLDSIIERSTQLARLQQGAADVGMSGFDLVEMLRDIRGASADAARVRLVAPEGLAVQSDPVLMKVILSNLVENALKYSAEGSAVTVTLDRAADRVRIAVENGAGRFGMPDPARVFSKFYRGEHAQVRFGSGLGLSIAQHLATVLGGVIRYEPEAQTVRFAVELPC